MGPHNERWTPEEEEALKAGVRKHGTGKWTAILKDSEYSSILKSRSNVNIKDKWRTIITAKSAMALGSRKKGRPALKRTPSSGPNQDDDNDGGPLTSVDKSILEAIIHLKRPFGSNGKSILLYIEENSKMLPDMKRLVTSRLKYLTHVGILVQIQHNYRISPKYMAEGATRAFLTKEAASAAARAVVEAEFAIAEAEEAAREVEEAESEAEAAHIFAKVVIQSFEV